MLEFAKEKTKGLLLYTQRYTNLDHVYLARSGFWVSLFNVLSIGLGIATTIVFTRFSDKITYGYYQFIIAVVGSIWIFSMPGVNTAVIQSIARGFDGSLWLGLKYKLRYSLLGALALLGVAAFFFLFKHDILLGKLFVISALLFPVHSAFSCLFSYFVAKKQFKKLSVYQTISRFFGVATLIFAVIYLKTAVWIIVVYFAASGLFNLYLYYVVRKKETLSLENEPDVLRFGKELTLSNILPQVLNNFDKLILPVFLGVESLALYAVAVKIPDTLKGFMNSFDNIFIPKMVDKEGSALIKKTYNFWIITAFVLGLAALILLLPWAIRFLFGEGYQAATKTAQVYSLAIPPLFFRRLLNNWMVANKQSKAYFENQTVLSVLSSLLILLGLVVYPHIVSVALAKIMAALVATINGIRLLRRGERVKI